MTTSKPRDGQVLPMGADTTILRSRTWERLKFEIEYALQRGTTANSYLIQADKMALIDPPGATFTQRYLAELEKRIDLKQLDYVILGHINPNRATTLKALVQLAPQVRFVCSNPGAIALRSNWELTQEEKDGWGLDSLPPLQTLIMRGEETLDLGKGHHLQFIPTPSPRWPDSLCTYDPQTEILYTDKFFGAHLCSDQVFDEGWTIFGEDRRYYYDCLMAPHARQVETALEKLSEYPARLYATGHGPLVRYALIPLPKRIANGVSSNRPKISKSRYSMLQLTGIQPL